MTTTSNSSAIVYALIDPVLGITRGLDAPEANGPAYVVRDYMNFDQIQAAGDLRAYRHIRSVWPLGYVTDPTQPISVTIGSTDSYGGTPFAMSAPQIFDGLAGTEELFYQAHGRAHSLRIDYAGNASFTLSGIDLGMSKQGDR